MPLPLQVVYAQLTKSITQPLNISFLTSPLSVSILTCIKVEGRCYLLSQQRLVLVLSSDLTVASLSVGEEVEAMQLLPALLFAVRRLEGRRKGGHEKERLDKLRPRQARI